MQVSADCTEDKNGVRMKSELELLDTIVSAILLLKKNLIMNNVGYILDTTLSVDLSILAPLMKICPKVNESTHISAHTNQ